MNRLVCALALIAALALASPASSQAAAPPLPTGQLKAFAINREDRSLTYLVMDSVTSKDGRFDYWILFIWSPAKVIGKTHMAQAMAHQMIDCGARTYEQTGIAIYDETGVGVGGGDLGRQAAVAIAPGSSLDTLAKAFCDGVTGDEAIVDGDAQALMVTRRFFENPPKS